jgi:hypothetical protein
MYEEEVGNDWRTNCLDQASAKTGQYSGAHEACVRLCERLPNIRSNTKGIENIHGRSASICDRDRDSNEVAVAYGQLTAYAVHVSPAHRGAQRGDWQARTK